MSAEIFKMIAYCGMIVFLNCIVAGLIDLLLGALFFRLGRCRQGRSGREMSYPYYCDCRNCTNYCS